MAWWKKIPDGVRIVILLLLIGAITWWGVYVLWGTSGAPGSARITYRVTGNGASVSLITYTTTDGTATEPEFKSLPWQLGPLTFNRPMMIVLTAHNSSQMGSVKCEIIRNGEVWKSDQVSNPDLNASCGGYVR